MKAILFILLVLPLLVFCLPAYSNKLFKQIIAVMSSEVPKQSLDEIRIEHKGKRVSGRGYIISITRDLTNKTIVNLSTRRDKTSPESVSIAVFVRKHFVKRALRLKIGSYVYFLGDFDGIRLRTMVIRKGIIK
jgi:hypothetical protein